MFVSATCSAAHVEYELSVEDGSSAGGSRVWLFEARGSFVAVTAVSCTLESWITFPVVSFSALSVTETRSSQR